MKSSLVSPPKRSARFRYLLTFISAMGGYCLAVAAISGWFRWEPPKAGIVMYLAAVLPSLPVGVAIFAILRYYGEEPDEFLRTVQIKSALIGCGLTMFTCTAWGFLAEYAHVWALPLYLVFPMWAFWMGLATPLVNLKYR
jgi:hypothetical protein